jgi:hypothetical protein
VASTGHSLTDEYGSYCDICFVYFFNMYQAKNDETKQYIANQSLDTNSFQYRTHSPQTTRAKGREKQVISNFQTWSQQEHMIACPVSYFHVLPR